MRTDTQSKILAYIKEKKQVSPKELWIFSQISQQALYRHLKKLLEKGEIVKIGQAPHVFYLPADLPQAQKDPVKTEDFELFDKNSPKIQSVIENNFLTVSPSGEYLEGLAGLNCDRAWDLRYEYLEKFPLFVAASLIGLNNEKSWEFRRRVMEINDPGEFGSPIKGVLGSLVGIDTEDAWELRLRYFNDEPFGVGTSLAGLENTKKNDYILLILQMIKDREKEVNDSGRGIKTDHTLTKLRKGLLQGLHSNYTWEAVKLNKKDI